jgi:uncharacterized repeat protein (TIGR03837 family)
MAPIVDNLGFEHRQGRIAKPVVQRFCSLFPSAFAMLWDIFCKVIDNHGDVGVCWRLARDLAARGQLVRLWLDDPSALQWMAPAGSAGVQVHPWRALAGGVLPGDVVVEAFGCALDESYVAAYAAKLKRQGLLARWINLEYFSAEPFAQRCHGLPSPLLSGPGQGLTKRFFYPGLTPQTGGLLREPDLAQRQSRFDRTAWLQQLRIPHTGERLVSLFCYEPACLAQWLRQLALASCATLLLVTPGRAAAALAGAVAQLNQHQPRWNQSAQLRFFALPYLSQPDYDHLLWACDINFVRGEDSLVRAIWAGKPFVWQIYPQHDNAHHAKLQAFLQAVAADGAVYQFHLLWNDVAPGLALPEPDACAWQDWVNRLNRTLRAQTDLTTRLCQLVLKDH